MTSATSGQRHRGLSLGARLRSELPLKIRVLMGLTVLICPLYFSLQRVQWAAEFVPPATALDLLVPFDPSWVLVYSSIYLVVPLFPLLAFERMQLLRFFAGLTVLCVPCFAVFALFPAAVPRPDLLPLDPAYRWLVSVDAPWNAFPSLHAGLTVYCFAFGRRVLRGDLRPDDQLLFDAIVWLWTAGILYGTLATKQHWAIDLLPAVALALAADHMAWRPSSVRGGLQDVRSSPADAH